MKPSIQRLRAKYRYSLILLRQLVVNDFKLRYQNSALGYLWSLLKPFFQFLILYVVFVRVLKVGSNSPHFGVALLLGIVLWNYFTEVTNGGIMAIVGRGDLLRKINFPRYVVILAGSVSALINLGINLIVVGVFIAINNVDVGANALILPLLIIELFVFALALSFLLSALYVRYRDVNHIWEVIMQGAFFATPIMYLLSDIYDQYPKVAKILIINPVAQIIQDARHVLIDPSNITIGQIYGTKLAYLIPFCIVATTGVVAGTYFRKRSRYFAEEV